LSRKDPILEREENRRIVFLAVCLLFLFLILERERERERERLKRKKTQQSNSLLRGISKRNAANVTLGDQKKLLGTTNLLWSSLDCALLWYKNNFADLL
jgi:hypothetical protein